MGKSTTFQSCGVDLGVGNHAGLFGSVSGNWLGGLGFAGIMIAVVFVVLAAFGAGAFVLHAVAEKGDFVGRERLALSFALGFGLIGWLLFPLGAAGYLEPLWIGAVLAACLPGLILLRGTVSVGVPQGPVDIAVTGLLAVVLVLALIQGLAPPADADSMAYHFAFPKRFVELHRLVFTPRAVDGAVPFLSQMTYVAPLALGGERAMTLWTAVSGCGAAALIYVYGRRHLPYAWALALALVWQTTPAVLYGAGGGQIGVLCRLQISRIALRRRCRRRSGAAGRQELAALLSCFRRGRGDQRRSMVLVELAEYR